MIGSLLNLSGIKPSFQETPTNMKLSTTVVTDPTPLDPENNLDTFIKKIQELESGKVC